MVDTIKPSPKASEGGDQTLTTVMALIKTIQSKVDQKARFKMNEVLSVDE